MDENWRCPECGGASSRHHSDGWLHMCPWHFSEPKPPAPPWRCEACKWWSGEAQYNEAEVPGYRYCSLASNYKPPVDYHNDDDDWRAPTAMPERKAFAVDGERYIHDLVTAPDFGCNQWDGK